MTTAERYKSGAEYTQPAVDALNLISNIEIPEIETSVAQDELLSKHDLGKAFAGIVEAHGYITYGAGGYRQLRGSDGKERFIATYYPRKELEDRFIPGAFHAFITRVAQFTEPNYIIPITIPIESGLPRVTRNEKGKYGRVIFGDRFDPKDSLEEVRHLAGLMSRALQGAHTGLGTFEVIE